MAFLQQLPILAWWKQCWSLASHQIPKAAIMTYDDMKARGAVSQTSGHHPPCDPNVRKKTPSKHFRAENNLVLGTVTLLTGFLELASSAADV